MIVFDLIPTEPLEYKVYADWLEDQGAIFTAGIRKGILEFNKNDRDLCGLSNEGTVRWSCGEASGAWLSMEGSCFGTGCSSGIGEYAHGFACIIRHPSRGYIFEPNMGCGVMLPV